MKFEEILRKLEEIVVQLEAEDTEIDKTLELYEEGMNLIRQCNQQLEERRGKLTVLRSRTDNE